MSKQRMTVLITYLMCSCLFSETAFAQARKRKPAPTRKFDAPGSPPFKKLKPGVNPPVDVDGNFVIGPKYSPAPERKAVDFYSQCMTRPSGMLSRSVGSVSKTRE